MDEKVIDKKSLFFRLIRISLKIVFWIYLFLLPFSLIAILYIVIHIPNYRELSNAALIPILKTCFDDLWEDFPFFDFISNIINGQFSLTNLRLNIQLNDVLKSLICYSLVNWVRRLFIIIKDTADKLSLKKIVILTAIYTSWFVLSVFVSDILLDTVFRLLERLPLHIEVLEKLIMLTAFYVIALLIFMYRSKNRLLFSAVWVLFDNVIIPLIIVLYFSLMNYWSFHILSSATSTDELYQIIYPIILCILGAIGIALLRKYDRLEILRLFRHT